MNNLKKQKGITLVGLTVTVIILLILSAVGVAMGIQGITNVKNSKLQSELEMVQHAVLEQYTKYKSTNDSSYLVGNKITDESAQEIASSIGVTLVSIPSTYSNKDYYSLDKASLSAIGIQDATDEYVVNYVSGEVMNITQKQLSNGTPLYTKATSF